ncbi:rCG48909, isoform CRA_b [Rattus norvegicus]|uniref:RCG48909, isoform CRA_b n=1 Tax=Rattus norvegicus TaxID=10116 RepID=A6IFX3_RAT|nr:rCG48909, isoform CRA_b [Rattus norvegicus]
MLPRDPAVRQKAKLPSTHRMKNRNKKEEDATTS